MHSLIAHIRRFDWLLLGAVLLLMGVGLVTLYSLSATSAYPFFFRQLVWVGVGLVLLVSASFVDFRFFRTQSVAVLLFYTVSVVLLAAVLLINLKVRGVEAWLRIGSFTVQPVEAAKLALIVLLAKFFSKRHVEIYRIRHLVVSGLYVMVPTALVLVQPDLGSALVLIGIWVVIVLFSGMKWRHIALLALLFAVASTLMWQWGLAPYQKVRVTSFLNPYEDSRGAGYQTIQSMIAVGSGRVWGKGLGYGSQSHLNFLPEAEADFIYAAFAEEWGFVGTLILIGLFSIVYWRIVHIGTVAADNFSRLYAIGFATYIFIQGFFHFGTNMGFLPITGITLPFVSYGGSSLIVLLLGVGFLQNIKMNARRGVE